MFKPRWCDLTDAGLGVGVSNFEVRFRDAELSRIWNSDYRIRVHRAQEDSSQGEAERTNAAVGDAVIDGGSIKWEYFPRFHDKSDEEIEKMKELKETLGELLMKLTYALMMYPFCQTI